MVKSIYDVERLQRACESCTVTQGHKRLQEELKVVAPELDLSFAFERRGWHRIGGVVLRDGTRVNDNLRQWAQSELGVIGPEMELPENWEDFLATRIDGRTVYLVAPTGPRAWDFVQLELEVLQEVVDRELFSNDFVPSDIEEFLDPSDVKRLEPTPIGNENYRFHGVYHIAQLIEELDKSIGTNRRFARFLVDWENSRAAAVTRLCDNWILKVFRYVDRFGEQKIEAAPFGLQEIEPLVVGATVPTGLALGRAISEFDKAAGYPMAWFFQMLTHQKNLHVVAEQAYRDHAAGNFAYLAEQDLAVLSAWYQEPYCF
jgi:hypothetical protein